MDRSSVASRRRARPSLRACRAFVALLALAALLPAPAAADPAESYLVRVADAISPGTAEFIHHSLKKAGAGPRRVRGDRARHPRRAGGIHAPHRPGHPRQPRAGGGLRRPGRRAGGLGRGDDHHGRGHRRHGAGDQHRRGPPGGGGRPGDRRRHVREGRQRHGGQRAQRGRAPRPQRRSGWSARSARASPRPRPRRCGSTSST